MARNLCQCLDHVYARELGVSVRWIRRLGGAAKLRGLSEDARNTILKPNAWSPQGTINPQKKHKGLKALGMRSMHPDVKGIRHDEN